MKIHNQITGETCINYLPKKRKKMIGYVASCPICYQKFTLRAFRYSIHWIEETKVKK